MVDAWLVVVVVILTLAIIAAAIYLVVYFQHPEDKNVAWFPKIVVVSVVYWCHNVCDPPYMFLCR